MKAAAQRNAPATSSANAAIATSDVSRIAEAAESLKLSIMR